MKILILGGASGFIGRNLAEYFAENPENLVYATFKTENKLDYPNEITCLQLDLMKEGAGQYIFDYVKPDIVINCVAYTTSSNDVINSPWKHCTINSYLNPLIFELCHTNRIKHCVWFSCGTMYANQSTPQKETDWKLGDDILKTYKLVAGMKTYCESLAKSYSEMGICKYTSIRLSNIFGKYDKTDLGKAHFLPSAIKKICDAETTVEFWGTPDSARRDFVYVDDVADLVERVIDKQKTAYELFNCGCGFSRSVGETVDLVKRAANKQYLTVTYNQDKPSIPVDISLDYTKAQVKLGWEPKTEFLTALNRTMEWYWGSNK